MNTDGKSLELAANPLRCFRRISAGCAGVRAHEQPIVVTVVADVCAYGSRREDW